MTALSLAVLLLLAHAEDQPVPVHTFHFVDKNLEDQTQMDEAAQTALKEFLSFSDCRYARVNRSAPSRQRWIKALPAKPEIFTLPVTTCQQNGAQAGIQSYCGGIVTCENRNTHYTIRDVFCKSVSGTICPKAKDCALDSHLTRSQGSMAENSAENGKQTRIVRQDMRGWDHSHVNRYSWTISDDDQMDKLEKETSAKLDKNNGENE